jgi:hypothetical protein
VKNLEVPLQVAIMTWFNNIQRKDLHSKSNIKPRYIVDYTIEVLKNNVAATMTLGVS